MFNEREVTVESRKSATLIVSAVLLAVMLSSCGKKERDTGPAADTEAVTHSESHSPQVGEAPKTETPNNRGAVKQGQEITAGMFKLTVPEDWKGNTDTQVWFPGTEDASKPLPAHSLHLGARPLMGSPSFEAGIKTHIGMEPQDKKERNVGQMKGIICQWQRGSYTSIGLFLLEKSAGMDLLYFFSCQAPEASFDQYIETYETILNSVTLK